VAFHETGFLGKLNQESGAPFWFQLGDQQRQQLGSPFGPVNPQALNRYSYVQNNPVKYTDPSGHTWYLNHQEAHSLTQAFWDLARQMSFLDLPSLLIAGAEIVTSIIERYTMTNLAAALFKSVTKAVFNALNSGLAGASAGALAALLVLQREML
jgi:hypothetical protein